MRASVLLLLLVACAKPATENERCVRTSDCVSGLVCCAGSCVDLQKDTRHCGACDEACPSQNAVAACVGATCKLSCGDGFADCNGVAADGCEVNTTNDARHCGSCGTACSLPNASSSTCSASQCVVSACTSGYSNCDGRSANGCEVVSASDLQNCGGCGAVCSVTSGTPRCTTGQCFVASCAPERADCDGLASTGCEVDTKTNAMHCNGCGQACAADQACADGMCRVLELFVFGGQADPTGSVTNAVKRLQLGQRLFTPVTPLTPGGTPSARTFHATAWDAMESRMLVFGGSGFTGALQPQVWSLTLGAMPTWNLLSTMGTAPSALVGQASGWDRTGRRWFLFGGTSQLTSTTRSAELFVFDTATSTWSQLNVAGATPPARAFAAAMFDDATSRFIVHGGRGASGVLSDTWVFDPATSTWTQVLMTGPAPREFSTFFSGSSPPVLFGGFDGTTHFDDLWELDVQAATWTQHTTMFGPPPRRHAAGLTVGGVRTLVSGIFDDGQTQTLFNDVWTLQWPARTWQQVRSNSLSGASDQRVGFSVISTEPR